MFLGSFRECSWEVFGSSDTFFARLSETFCGYNKSTYIVHMDKQNLRKHITPKLLWGACGTLFGYQVCTVDGTNDSPQKVFWP